MRAPPRVLMFAACGAAVPLGSNLVSNADFAEVDESGLPVGWAADRNVYRRVTDEVYNGSAASLAYDTHGVTGPMNCTQFTLDSPCWCTQHVAGAVPGRRYALRAWVRGVGAAVAVQWQRGGTWVGGAYSDAGASDAWGPVGQPFLVIPPDADRVTVSAYNGYMDYSATRAWFARVELREVAPPPLRSAVVSPAYRGLVTRGTGSLAVRLWLHLAAPADVVAELRARNVSGFVPGAVWTSARVEAADPAGKLDLPLLPASGPARSPQDIPAGEWELVVRCVDPSTNATLAERAHAITRANDRAPDAGVPKVYFDSSQRTWVDGEPFFPIGLYFMAAQMNATLLGLVRDSAFNCVLPYGAAAAAELDAARAAGLRVIAQASGTDAEAARAARSLRAHPALLAWYLADEQGGQSLPQQVSRYRAVASADPDHPAYSVYTGSQVADLIDFADSFDAVGTDPYPIGNGPGVAASEAGRWTNFSQRGVAGCEGSPYGEICDGVSRLRPLWMVIQTFNHNNTYLPVWPKNGLFRTPTRAELRSMVWQAICGGANGIILYSFFELLRNVDVDFATGWASAKAVAAEVRDWAGVLYAPRRVTPAGLPTWVATRAHSSPKKGTPLYYLFCVNDGDGSGDLTFDIGVKVRTVTAVSGGGRRSIRPDPGSMTFRDKSAPLQVEVYEVVEDSTA